MPFFCKHSRIAAKRAEPRPPPDEGAFAPVEDVPLEDVPVVEEPVEAVPVDAALVGEDVVLEEPPHAASPMQASSRINRAAAAVVRLLVFASGMKLLCR